MEELKNLVEKLKTIRTEVKLKISDNVLFEQAVDIFLSKQIGEQQDKRAGMNKPNPNAPLTEKQKQFLIKNDYRGDMNLTKLEASKLIDEFIKGSSQEYQDY